MTQFCRYCGTKMPSDSVFCHICGQKQLSGTQEETSTIPTDVSSPDLVSSPESAMPLLTSSSPEDTFIAPSSSSQASSPSHPSWPGQSSATPSGIQPAVQATPPAPVSPPVVQTAPSSPLSWPGQPPVTPSGVQPGLQGVWPSQPGWGQQPGVYQVPVQRPRPAFIPPQTGLQKVLVRIFRPWLATNAAVGVLLGAILAAVLGGAVSGLLIGVLHLIAPSQFDNVLAALGVLSLHSPWRDTLGALFATHGIALKAQFDAHSFLEITTSKATPGGLLVIPACCLTLGGYVAASTDFSNRALHSLWRGAAIALPYAILLLLFIPAVNGSVPFPGAAPDESTSVTIDGTSLFFFCLLWGVLFGLLGASLKLGSRRWRQMLSIALRFNRFPQIGATIAGAGAAIGLGLALSLLCLYSFLAYASFSTPTVKQYLLVSDDWQSKAAWSLSRGPLYATNLFMYSFNAPFQFATNRGDNALCPFNPGGSPNEFAPCETTLSMFGGSPHLPPWTFAFLSIAVLSLFLGGRVSASIGRAQRAGPGLLQGAAIALPFTLLMVLLAALTNDFVQDTFTSTSVTTITFSQGVSPSDVLPWAFLSSVLLGALGGLYQVSSLKQGMSAFLRVLSAPLRWLGVPATWLGERLRGCPADTRPTTALVLLYNALFWSLVLLVVMGVVSAYLIEQALAIALHTNELIRDILSTLLVTLPGLLLLSAGAAALAENTLPPSAPAALSSPTIAPPTGFTPVQMSVYPHSQGT